MASVLQQYHQLTDRMATQITGSYQSWTDFLTTAARLYKYPYHEQLMIYAQRPEATACADYELWNKRMGRYVRRGAKGIALIDHSGDTPKLKYVFDVADTHTTERSRSPYLWEYRPEHEQVVSAAMEEQYNIQYPGNLVDQLEQISSVKVTEFFLAHQQDILDIVDGSYLEQYHDYDKGVAFLNAATVSTTYMLLSRCGLAENAHFAPEDFMPVFDFNTPQTVYALGSAISGISEEILRNIEVTIKKYEREKLSERSQENERTDLHSQRGLPDSQSEPVPAGEQAPGQVREDAEEVSSGASPGAVELPDPDGEAVSPSAGDRRNSEPAVGADDAHTDAVGRSDGSSESQRPHEMGGADEQPESPSRGSDPDGVDLHLTEDSPVEQFSFFPTEAQQIESITEAERVQATPSAFSMFISQADIDHILRTGGNEDDARMKIVAEFSKQKPLENRATFLKALYHGGNGLITENGKISAWYGEGGIHIASGDTARYLPAAQVISWADAAGRTEELLDSGTFATNLEVAEAPRNERQRIAAKVWSLYHDLSDEAKSLGHLSCLSNIRSTNYPEETERLTDELANPAFREILLTESRAFVDAYRKNRELLRFHYHRPQVLLTQLEELSMPRKEYHSNMAALPETGKFITEDEIADSLANGSSFEGGKNRIYAFFQNQHSLKEKADFLKEEYGTGGRSHAVSGESGSFEEHGSKGIVLKKSDCTDIQMNWNKVASRISELIRLNRYFTPDEQVLYDEKLAQATARTIAYNSYNAVKEAHPDDIVLHQIGDFFEIYGEDAKQAAERLGMYLTTRNIPNAGRVEMCGLPAHNLEMYVEKLRNLRVYGNYPDERAHAEAAGRDWVEKSAASTESDIAPADRFHVVSLDQGFYTRYAIWDDEADGYYVDADGVAEEFTSEWQAEEYRLKLQEQVLMERAKGLISDFCQSEYGSEPDFSDPAKIGIAYTTITDDEIPIQVIIDLVKFRLERDLNGEHLETRQYSSLQDLIANELEILDFSDLVHVSDEDIEQYRWHNREEATEKALETVESVSLPQENKALYSVGDTVYLDNKPFEITEVGLFDVHLRDPSQAYPVFRAESKERLEVLLRQDERNAHLFAVKPPAISEEEKLILEHEGQAALSEMGELIPNPDDAISQAEPDEPPAHSPAVSILIDGQWQEFPSTSTAEKASYADFKAASHRNAQNFRITDDDLGAGGAKAKFQANLNAIQLLKHLEAEGLQASPEQQQVLSRYVGWGGLPDAFDASKPSWASEYQALKAAFTPEEYTAARASTLNAHYTSPTVIRAIYEAVENMGFQTGNILEPSMGIGNFFGMLPEKMRSSRLYGVELDSITGRIAKQLYPKANITIAGFETTDRRDFFDLAIGNVPFGQYKVNDPTYNKLGFNIHNYFLAKALDQVRPGGVVAFVTSRYSMDAQNPSVRKYLAQRADLLGAIRLPNTAFKANAGTEVVSDILFLQKRDRAIDIEPDWVHLGQTEDGYAINSYFLDHPEMVMGRNSSESTAHGMDYTVEPLEDISLADQLHEAVRHIHGTYQEVELPDLGEGEEIRDTIPADPDVKNFSYALVDGEVYFRENSVMVRPQLNNTARERVKGMIGLKDCVRQLIDLQMDEYSPDSAIQQKQAELNTLYDSFTEKYGILNSRGNRLAFSDDSAYYLLCALEILDDDGNFQRKADMFSKRTIQPHKVVTSVDTAVDALTISIGERACVDLGYMSSLSGKSIDELTADLQGVIFHDPKLGTLEDLTGWVTADEYLSGNVRQKLKDAETAAAENPMYRSNVEALRAAQPKDLEASEIEVRLGATWIDKAYIQQFMYELLDTPYYLRRSIHVEYSPYTAAWNISNKRNISGNDVAAWNTYGTDYVSAYEILEDSLNLRDVRVYDTVEDEHGKPKRVLNGKQTTLAQQKQQLIRDAFKDWIWADPTRRQSLVEQYNQEMNSIRPREYDGSHIVFAGMNPEIRLREHQRNAIAHVLYGGNTLLAHEVGAGKTFEMVGAAMEAKRLGLCRKSLFVVPNHLTEQWASEFLRLYPSANILVTKQKDFETRNRKKFCARIATGDYDAVIIGHSQFEKIPISQERQEALLEDQIEEITLGISELRSNNAERFSIKQLERAKRSLEARLEKLQANDKKDDVVTFEELGVDRLFVDEAHSYKNLFLYTKMQNVAGLSTSDAQKSSDMFAKCRYMDELTGGRGVIFATGTPVSNSMTELYTMQRYLQYDRLQEMGMVHFDCWASRFGETVTALELAPEGKGYRPRTRFSRFFNLPELMNIFREVADIKTADQLHLPVPEVEYHNVAAKPSEVQQKLVQELSERAALIHSGSVSPDVDNMLKITSDGRKLGLDQRIINPAFPDDPESKVNLCVGNILQMWQGGEADKLTQLVFCDVSTPQAAVKAKATALDPHSGIAKPFTVYEDIRSKLIAQGVPPEQIAFIHDANSEAKKKELFGKVRSGQVRVLLGSTAKMGAGTNVQDRLVAIHDLDCPWRPGDLAQRKGRIERQGNQNEKVHVFRYVTEGTFDAYLWQTVENKQKFISQIMSSKNPVRSCEDVDEVALSFAEIKALCAGDPRIKERMDLDVDVARLKIMKADYKTKQFRLEDSLIRSFPAEIAKMKEQMESLKADMQTLSAHPHPDGGFAGMTVLTDNLLERENAGAALMEAAKQATGLDPVEIGSYRGFAMSVTLENFGKKFVLTMQGKLRYQAELGSDPKGNLIRLDNALAQMPQRMQSLQTHLEETYHQQEAAKAELEKPWPYEQELRDKTARLIFLDAELNLDARGQSEPEQVIPKSSRPSVLSRLKTPPSQESSRKQRKHHEEVR